MIQTDERLVAARSRRARLLAAVGLVILGTACGGKVVVDANTIGTGGGATPIAGSSGGASGLGSATTGSGAGGPTGTTSSGSASTTGSGGVPCAGVTCKAGASCVNGQCVCEGGLQDCLMACTNISSDPNNYGGCSQACGAGICNMGKCFCEQGKTFCGPKLGCLDLSNDKNHCGDCTQPCEGAEVCQSGQCQGG